MRTVTLAGAGGGYSQPSPAPSGQGRRQLRGGIAGKLVPTGDARYLWLLLGIEYALTLVLRHWSRNHHGG